MRFILFVALLFCAFPAFASSIKSDEEVIFFRTAARQGAAPDTWIIPVHAWVFEPEEGLGIRSAAVAALASQLDLGDDVVADARFTRMARWFLVDNESGKTLRTTLVGDDEIGPTGANGHARKELTVKFQSPIDAGSTVSYSAVVPSGDRRLFRGESFLAAPEGISVISDIDDTIKISEVLDKKKLMENTFLKDYVAAPGMAEAYKRLAGPECRLPVTQADCASQRVGYVTAFHYLSSSPWQLYPALAAFMDGAGFPKGSFHMRDFRMKDETVFNVMKSSEETKPPGIVKLFEDFPKRQFILIGDSGEKDPEIYGKIARAYPGRVKHIYIRKVTPEAQDDVRYKTAFESVEAPFTLFEDASVIMP